MKKALTIFAGIALFAITVANVAFTHRMVCTSVEGGPHIFKAGSLSDKTLKQVCGFENHTSLKANR